MRADETLSLYLFPIKSSSKHTHARFVKEKECLSNVSSKNIDDSDTTYIPEMYLTSSMYSIVYFSILFISFPTAQSSPCSEYYRHDYQQQQCECENTTSDGISYVSLKCVGHSYVPHFSPSVRYRLIELESCPHDLQVADKTFADLNINTLRFRHCNLLGLHDQSFSKINHLQKFSIENATINSLATSTGNFQEIFTADSFQTLKSLTFKNVHYHQAHKHDKKLNLELLLSQLPQLQRIELINIQLDNHRHKNITSFGSNLTYFKLINTHQTDLLPIEHLSALRSLILLQIPQVFRTQPLLASLKKLPKLEYIDLTNNQLTDLDGLQSKSLDQIDLSSNLLTVIPEYAFEHVPKLHTLILTGNPLTTIDRNAFCGVGKLARLSVNTGQNSAQLSPLNNCLLFHYPHLKITQDSQAKFACNCQLMYIFQLKPGQNNEINHLFKRNQVCLVTNETLYESKSPEQFLNHYNAPINTYELENALNCSRENPCDRLCQERKPKSSTLPPLTLHKADVKNILRQSTSLSLPLSSFFSYPLFLLLLASLYL